MIQREERDGVVTMRLAHGKANALDLELCRGITDALQEAQGSRAVILTSDGKIFSAGVDLIRLTNEGQSYVRQFFPALVEVLTALFSFPRPLVAAVNGHAIAGGCLMAQTADYRLISGGTIGVPELSVGVPFPAIAIEILRYATGANAHRLASGADIVQANEAKSRSLVDEAVEPDQLLSRAREVAERLASSPRDAYAITKAHLRAPFLRNVEAAADLDRQSMNIWGQAATLEHIRGYLARTIRK